MASILIVDDSRLSRQLLRRHLPENEHEIREASDGQECLRLYQEKRADLVFMDLTMPGMDGFETIWHLKNLDPQARVVVVTADIQSGSRAKCLELGALQVVAKPPAPGAITEVLRSHLP
jgi:two-component system chemotaxis response regulator CheY